jgi:hypothetical protein
MVQVSPTTLVLIAGCVLRAALALFLPGQFSYDDHVTPMRLWLDRGALPRAEDCWSCYQPPLYYAVSLPVYYVARDLARAAGYPPRAIDPVSSDALQWVSVLAGCATLYVSLLILRRVLRLSEWQAALALSLIAFLPQHVYMSAIVTNDAWTYLVATLAIYSAVRSQQAGWPLLGCLATGALAGACVLSKAYGVMTAAAIGLTLVVAATVAWLGPRAASTPGEAARPAGAKAPVKGSVEPPGPRWRGNPRLGVPAAAVIVPCVAVAIGMWPAVRNLQLYGRPHVDNFDFFSGPMLSEPPGSVSAIDFASLRLVELLRHPWVHPRHLDSFWTEIYARAWFDYEGFSLTLPMDPSYAARFRTMAPTDPTRWTRGTWLSLMAAAAEHPPLRFAPGARIAYVAGLPLALGLIAGFVVALRRIGADFGATLLSIHALACAAVPIVQTLRLPVFSAMKPAFALGAISSLPFLMAVLLLALPRGTRRIVGATLWAAVAAVALSDVLFVAAVAHYIGLWAAQAA